MCLCGRRSNAKSARRCWCDGGLFERHVDANAAVRVSLVGPRNGKADGADAANLLLPTLSSVASPTWRPNWRPSSERRTSTLRTFERWTRQSRRAHSIPLVCWWYLLRLSRAAAVRRPLLSLCYHLADLPADDPAISMEDPAIDQLARAAFDTCVDLSLALPSR